MNLIAPHLYRDRKRHLRIRLGVLASCLGAMMLATLEWSWGYPWVGALCVGLGLVTWRLLRTTRSPDIDPRPIIDWRMVRRAPVHEDELRTAIVYAVRVAEHGAQSAVHVLLSPDADRLNVLEPLGQQCRNTAHGHAMTVRRQVRHTDVVCALSDGQIAVLQRLIRNADEAHTLASRLQTVPRPGFDTPGRPSQILVGTALIPEDGTEPGLLLDVAASRARHSH